MSNSSGSKMWPSCLKLEDGDTSLISRVVSDDRLKKTTFYDISPPKNQYTKDLLIFPSKQNRSDIFQQLTVFVVAVM